MTDRKATLLASDPKLKDLTEQREITTRKHNEAINSGLDQEASDLANELKLIDTSIKRRKTSSPMIRFTMSSSPAFSR